MAANVTFLQNTISVADASSYTFAAQNLSTAAADRYIIVGVSARGVGAPTLDSVTIGGVSATLVAMARNTVSNLSVTTLAVANVPTGTTGDVVVTFSAGMVRCGIGVFRTTGINPTPTGTATSVADAPTQSTLDVVAGGFAVAVAHTAGDNATTTWTGLTERYDQIDAELTPHTGASDDFASTQTDLTITATFTVVSNSAGSFASWEAAPATSGKNFLSMMGIGQ